MAQQEKESRVVFWVILALGAFCAFLWTATTLVEPDGFGFVFRLIACSGLTVGFLGALAVDRFAIYTGHWPYQTEG
ncbi:MAG: hypothetical protein FJW31_18835 [Acidobacteria bacterium]|nr:hypothetical protein [Acidobacteriota bacterium]